MFLEIVELLITYLIYSQQATNLADLTVTIALSCLIEAPTHCDKLDEFAPAKGDAGGHNI